MYEISAKLYDRFARPEEAAKAFRHFGIVWTEHNNGWHWKLTHNGTEYNYFPTSGKWYTVKPKHSCTHNERFLSGLLRTLGFEFKEIV